MPKITDLQFDEELIVLLTEMQQAEHLVPMLMVLDDVWQQVSDELHDEVVKRIEKERRDRRG